MHGQMRRRELEHAMVDETDEAELFHGGHDLAGTGDGSVGPAQSQKPFLEGDVARRGLNDRLAGG